MEEAHILPHKDGRRGSLMVSTLDSGSSGPGSSPGLGHCIVFSGKTLSLRSRPECSFVRTGTLASQATRHLARHTHIASHHPGGNDYQQIVRAT